MKQYVCSVCGYVYDEANGIPEAGIKPGTLWEELPGSWKCPWCGAGKEEFREKGAETAKSEGTVPVPENEPHVEKELSAMEMSIVCSNLARGCEKQCLMKQSEEFRQLSDFFRNEAEPVKDADIKALMKLFEKDLETGFSYANAAAAEYADRGAKRSLLWAEKITRMLKSILKRFETEGNAMLENTGVFVCTACGFVYVGDAPPEVCPVCKVPSWKFEKVEGRTK